MSGAVDQTEITGRLAYGWDGTNAYPLQVLASGRQRVSAISYLFDIAKGNIPNHTAFRIQGSNDDVDNVKEDVWAVGGTYVFPTGGIQMELVSTSDEDSGAGGVNPAGTGIRSVEIHYLDTAWADQAETKVLDGTTVVTTVATDIFRINKMHAVTAGSGGMAAGNIDIRHLDNTPVYGRIPTNETTLHQAVSTVPIGKTLFVVSWQPGIGATAGNRYGRFELDGTSNDDDTFTSGIFFNKNIIDIQDMAIFILLPMIQKFPAKTDVKVTVISDAAAANALTSVSFEGWLEDA